MIVEPNDDDRKAASEVVAPLNDQFAASTKLEKAIRANLKGLGYGG